MGVNGVTKQSYDGVKKSYDLLNPPATFEDAPTTKLAENGSVKLLKYTPSPIFVDTRDATMFEQNTALTPLPAPVNPPNTPKLEAPPRLHDQMKTPPTSAALVVEEVKPRPMTPPTTPPTSTPLFIQETVTVSRSLNVRSFCFIE